MFFKRCSWELPKIYSKMHVSIKLWVETCNFIIKENPTEVFSCEFLQNKTPPSDCFFNSISRFESSVNLNFLAFLGKVNEPPILLLRHESVKVRTYAETCSGRYSYHQLLLEFPRFTMKISLWKYYFAKVISRWLY